MPAPLVKLIPTLALLAMLGYLAWSHFAPDEAPVTQPSKLPEISADLLHPAAPPQTERDPFGKTVRFELGETSDERPAPGKKTGAKTETKTAGGRPAPPRPGTAGARGVAPGGTAGARGIPRGTTGTGQMAGAPAVKLSPAEKAVAVNRTLSEMVLNATLLSGDQRVAMINGRVYRPGDPVGAAGAPTQMRLAEIHHHRVVLEHEGKRMDLAYSNRASATTPRAKPGARNTPVKNVKTGAKTRPGVTPPPRPRPPDAPPAR